MSDNSGADIDSKRAGRAEALKTAIEQTKLLVTLASGFVLAPPAVLSVLRRPDGKVPLTVPWGRFFSAEGLLIGSILAGYVVLGTIAGSQHSGTYDVYRKATRLFSLGQFFLYVAGLAVFLFMTKALL